MGEKKTTLTLDTCCFDKLSDPILIALQSLQQEGVIDMWHEHWTRTEMRRWITTDTDTLKKRDTYSSCKNDACFIPQELWNDTKQESEFIDQRRGFSFVERKALMKKLQKILFPAGIEGKRRMNKYADIRILAYHILRKRMYFVSKDNVFFDWGNKKKLEADFPGVKIRRLNEELIGELKSNSKEGN